MRIPPKALWLAWIAMVSCDRPSDASTKDHGETPKITRSSKRPEREGTGGGTHQRLREALDEALLVESAEARDQALDELARAAITQQPEIAAEAVANLSPGSTAKHSLIQFCISRLMEHSSDEAIAWAESLKNDQDAAAAKAEIALLLMESKPEAAFPLLSAQALVGSDDGSAAREVLQNWAATTPKDAAAWVAGLPAGEAREAGMRTVVSQWLQGDSAAALSWVNSLGQPVLREQATRLAAAALLDQPQPLREAMLETANPSLRTELEAGVQQMIEESNHAAESGENAPGE